MGILNRIFKRSAAVETRSAGDFLPSAFGMFGGGGYNDTGVQITEQNALISSTVWACVSVISQTIASLPVHVLTRDGGEKQYAHPVAKLLSTTPNPYMTPAVFREAVLQQALLWGGGYAAIEKDEVGHPTALYPLASSRTKPIRQGGELLYETRVGNDTHYLTPDRVVCLLGWSQDGITPLSPIQSGKQAVALSVAMERYAAKAFSGANVGGILQTPPMNKDAMANFVESWKTNYSGLDAAFKVAVLPDPMKFVPTTLKPQEGQLVEARQAIVLDICRYYRVPPWMVGILEKSSYASMEAQSMAFYQGTIQPWVVKLEQELMSKLLLESEKDSHEVRFNLDAFLRATTTERYGAYQQGRQGGWLSINDIRRKEGLPQVDGGDSYLSPLNMTPVDGGSGGAAATPPAEPEPDNTAARSLIEDAARRVLTKESKALLRAVKKHTGPELRQWANAFYTAHAELVARVFTAPLKAAGLGVDPHSFAKEHCEASLRSIASAPDAHDLTDEWADIRPFDIANTLMEKRNAA